MTKSEILEIIHNKFATKTNHYYHIVNIKLINKENLVKWINELRTTTNKQGNMCLVKQSIPKFIKEKANLEYCCLGILGETQNISVDTMFEVSYLSSLDFNYPLYVTTKEFDNECELALERICIAMNDTYKFTFNEIADILQLMLDYTELSEEENNESREFKNI